MGVRGFLRWMKMRLGALVALALIACTAALAASASTQQTAAAALPDQIKLEIGAKADYGGWGTYMMEAGGNTAFCVQPDKTTPTTGTYPVSALDAPSGENDVVRAMVYFGYGGPGYDRSIWPTRWPLAGDTKMTQARYYALSHLTASLAWLGNMDDTLYRVWDDRGEWLFENVFGEDENGRIVNSSAPYQKIKARAAEVPDSFQVFEINTGGGDQIVVGWRMGSDVTFTKTSANTGVTAGNDEYDLSGAKYRIYRSSDDALVTTVTIGKNGKASYTLEPNTSYYAVETAAPAGYTLDKDPVSFKTGSGAGTVRLKDQPQTVELVVRKKDAATGGEAQPGTSLAGAVFDVTYPSKGGTKTASVTTDETGRAQLGGLPLGEITVRETAAPEGYKLDGEPRTYTVSAGGQATAEIELDTKDDFLEQVVAVDIEISKYTETVDEEGTGVKEPAEGVRFEIVSNTTHEVVATVETGADGKASTADPECVSAEAVSKEKTYDPSKPWFGSGKRTEEIEGSLPYDSAGYTVREVPETVPEGFERVDDWTIPAGELADGASLRYIVNNHSVSTRLQIVKTDAASGQTVPLAGFSFQVLDAEKNPVSQESWYPNHSVVDVFETDDTGSVTLPEVLEAGTYYIRELKAEPPYIVGEDLEFAVGSTGEEPSLTVLAYADAQATGAATIEKADSVTGEKLAGAEFDVVAQADVVSPDGSVQATEGEVVAHVQTDENGKARAAGLPLGSGKASYAFVETRAPEGYILDTKPITFKLSWKDDETPVVETAVEAENDASTLVLDKTSTGSGDPLQNAVFALWNIEDEVSSQLHEGSGQIALVGDADAVRLASDEGELHFPAPGESGAATVELPFGSYGIETLSEDGTWKAAGTVVIEEANARKTLVAGERIYALPCLLRAAAQVETLETDEHGNASARKLSPGSYRLLEIEAPAGYLVSQDIHEVEVGADGVVEPKRIEVSDVPTTVEVSKTDITGEKEVAGAHLEILDADGETVDSWTSTDAPHVVEALAPGSYVLVETMAPRTYEMSQSVPFEVLETGDVQRVSMADEPVEVTGQVDKRQEVATPVAEGVTAEPAAVDPQGEGGSYSYSVDFRSTSSTWVDEFTVTDDLVAATDGLATLESVVTPQAWQDFDGKLNVWYRTNLSAEEASKPDANANATLSDGHPNPWLEDEKAMERDRDGDGRIIDYTGWRLWREDVPSAIATKLEVADLNLEPGEIVTGVRLEYGRVEVGFTSRPSLWDRDGLKSERDDLDEVAACHEDSFADDDRATTAFAPLVVNMRVTGDYVDGTTIENEASVELYRNGGVKGLEDRDDDRVVQAPQAVLGTIPQTGSTALAAGGAVAVLASAAGLAALKRNMPS